MGRYIITYAETYEEDYEVEADGWSEAQEKLMNDICEGRRKRPEKCCDMRCKATRLILRYEGLDNGKI